MPDANAIVKDLTPRLRKGDVLLIMSNGGFGGIHQKLLDAIVKDLTPRLAKGDVVLIMSNGGFGGVHQKLLDALES